MEGFRDGRLGGDNRLLNATLEIFVVSLQTRRKWCSTANRDVSVVTYQRSILILTHSCVSFSILDQRIRNIPVIDMHENSDKIERNPLDEIAVRDPPTQTGPEPPPDGEYGWVCVAACFTINCFTWGVVAVSLKAEGGWGSC